MRRFFLVVFAFLLIGSAFAQDPHFSQFFASPLTLNPAFTGKFDGDYRFTANYRNQWPSIPNAYITESASLDFGILKKNLPQGDVFGIGISGLSDQSANDAISFNYGSASLAYHKALDDEGYNTLGIGFQATYSSMTIYPNKLVFASQLGENGFTGGSSGESFPNGTAKNYFDMNTGILFSGSSDGENNYYGGLSFYHINSPTVGLQNQNWQLSPRITAHAGGTFPLNDQLAISASAIEQIQDQANESMIGAALSINAGGDDYNPTNVFIGSWYRVGDAVIPYIGLQFNGWKFGATYDVNLSSLKAATDEMGGTEFSVIYIKKKDEQKGIPCPQY